MSDDAGVGKKAAQLMYEEFTEDVEARLWRTGVKVLLTLAQLLAWQEYLEGASLHCPQALNCAALHLVAETCKDCT